MFLGGGFAYFIGSLYAIVFGLMVVVVELKKSERCDPRARRPTPCAPAVRAPSARLSTRWRSLWLSARRFAPPPRLLRRPRWRFLVHVPARRPSIRPFVAEAAD